MFIRKKEKIPSQRSVSKEKNSSVENRNNRVNISGQNFIPNQRSIPNSKNNFNSNDYTVCSLSSFNTGTSNTNFNNVVMPPAYPSKISRVASSPFQNYNRNLNTSINNKKSARDSNAISFDLNNLSQDKILSPKTNYKFTNNIIERCKSQEKLRTVSKEKFFEHQNQNLNYLPRDSSRNSQRGNSLRNSQRGNSQRANSQERRKNDSFNTQESQNFTSVDYYLQRRHTEAQEKLQRLKTEKMKKEEAELRDRPKISKNSQKIVQNLVQSNGNVIDRLTSGSYNRKKAEKINQIEEINRKTLDKPKINPTSEKLQRTIDDLYYWQNNLNTKMEEAKQKQSQVR
jgi:hypothetical protein